MGGHVMGGMKKLTLTYDQDSVGTYVDGVEIKASDGRNDPRDWRNYRNRSKHRLIEHVILDSKDETWLDKLLVPIFGEWIRSR